MKAVLGYLLGIFVLCHITKEQLFKCDKRLDYNTVPCNSGTCCTPEDKVVIPPAVSYPTWFCWFWLGSYHMFVEGPNKICVNVSGLCSVTLSYCYRKDTPSSSTTTVATFSSSTRLDNVSNSPITFENTPTSTSGVKESTESYFSSYMPETKEVKVSSVGVIVGVSVAVLVLTIFGVVIFLVIRIRRKRTQKRTTTPTSKRPTLASNCVSTDITYSAVKKGTRTKVTEQLPILEFRNYSNYRKVQCADSNEENAYDSTDLQTNHAVIDDTYDHTVSIVNNNAVIEDTYDHTVSIVNNHAVIEDTYDHTVSSLNSHAVIEDTYDHTVSPVNSHSVIEDTYDPTVSNVNNHAVIPDTYDHTVSPVNSHVVIEDTQDNTVSPVNSHAIMEDAYDHTVSPINSHAVIEDTYDHTVSAVNSHAVMEDTYDPDTLPIRENRKTTDTQV